MRDVFSFRPFLREEAGTLWDLATAAPRIDRDRMENLRYLADQLKSYLELKERLEISHIAIADNEDLGLADLYEEVHVEHGLTEVSRRHYFGMDIKHAYIITSQRLPAIAAKQEAA